MPSFYVYKKKWRRICAAIFDFLGTVLTFFISKNFSFSTASIKKILLIRIDHLGDALLLRPALAQLRHVCPDARIHLLSTPENAPVFLLDPFIDAVIPMPEHWFQKKQSFFKMAASFWRILFKIRGEHYDAAVDFRGDVRVNALMFLAGIPIRLGYGITGGGWMLTHKKSWDAAKHQVMLNVEMLRDWNVARVDVPNLPVVYPPSAGVSLHRKIASFPTPYGVIHPGAGDPLKEWPWSFFLGLFETLPQSGGVKTLFLIGTDAEKKRVPAPVLAGVVDLRGATDLHELACLLEGAAFFVGHDSGPAHLAAAQTIPVIVLASSTNQPEVWRPWTKKLAIISKNSDVSFATAQVLDAARTLSQNSVPR